MSRTEEQPRVYEDLAALAETAQTEADEAQLQEWREEIDAKRENLLSSHSPSLPRLGIDHAGVIMTEREVAAHRTDGTDQDRVR